MKLSESIENRDMDVEKTRDELALARIKKQALRRAGFAPRRIGKRTLIALASALAAVFVFTTALALTDMGAKLADMLKGHAGAKETLDVLGIYGSAVGTEATDKDITVRVDAAYADDGFNVLAISIEDALGRFTEGMDFSPNIESRVSGGTTGWHRPYMDKDGVMHTLITFERDAPVAGRNIQLTIDKIVPGETYHDEPEDIDLTLDEALALTEPRAVQGIPGVAFLDAHFEKDGLVVSFDVPGDESLYLNALVLLCADGTRIEHDARSTIYGEWAEGESAPATNRDEFGFPGLKNGDDLQGARFLLSYTIRHTPIPGNWSLSFRMPKSSGKAKEVALDTPFAISGAEFRLGKAKLYPSCVTLDFSVINDMLYQEEVVEESIVFNEELPWPEFEIVCASEEKIDASWTIDPNGGDAESSYTVVFPCATEQYDALTLVVTDRRDGTVLLEKPLK